MSVVVNETVQAITVNETTQNITVTVAKQEGSTATDSFKTINCPSGTDPVADSSTDTLNLTASESDIEITGNSTTDTVDLKLATAPYPITSSAPAQAAVGNNKVQYYINEAAKTLNFKLKDSSGSILRGAVDLIGGEDWSTGSFYTGDSALNLKRFNSSTVTGDKVFAASASAYTIAMTLNFDMSITDTAYLLSFFDGTSTGKLEIIWINSAFRFQVGSAFSSAQPTRADKDYHIVCVYDGGLSGNQNIAKIYVDAVNETNGDSGTMPTTIPTAIGDQGIGVLERNAGSNNPFTRSIKELSLYNKALSSAEVSSLYNSGSYADPATVSGLISSWWFGDNSSDDEYFVYDNIGVNHLTCVGFESGDITRA